MIPLTFDEKEEIFKQIYNNIVDENVPYLKNQSYLKFGKNKFWIISKKFKLL